jgi:hypothetical protein
VFTIDAFGVPQEAPTGRRERPIARRKSRFKETNDGVRDDRLVRSLHHSVGLRNAWLTKFRSDAEDLTGLLKFAGVVRVQNSD